MSADQGGGAAAGKAGEKSLRLRISSLATIIFLSVAAIAVAYVAGVMTGRHEGDPPRLQSSEPAPLKPEPQEPEPVLSPEELEFARALRGQASAPRAPVRAEQEPGHPLQAEAPPPAEVPDNQPQSERKDSLADVYDYVFQMGAFRDEAGADNLRRELEGLGFRTSLEKNGKMLIILVKLRGNAERAQEILQVAAKLRLGAPIMRSRKEVRR